MTTWILDTGPLVAYLNPKDPSYREVKGVIEGHAGRLVTSSAVITETMFFMVEQRNGPAHFVDFLETGQVKIIEFCQTVDLARAVDLMNKYSDTPMDFADATLILLADLLNQHKICTLDRRGFRTFRTPKGKRFTLVMDA